MGYLFKSRSQEAAENCCIKLQDSRLHWTIIIIVASARPGPTGLYKVCLDNTAGHKTAAAAAAASPHQPSLHVCSNAVCRNGGTRSLKRRRRVQKPYGGGANPSCVRKRSPWRWRQVATLMVATARIAVAALIILSYSPCCSSVHRI